MDEREFKNRTKRLGVEVVRVLQVIHPDRATDPLVRQLVRSSTAVGSNYRAACRARSRADIISKLGIVEEEADETLYWLEVLEELKVVRSAVLQPLIAETNEVLAMTVASIKTLRGHSRDGYPEIKVVQSKIQNPKSKMDR